MECGTAKDAARSMGELRPLAELLEYIAEGSRSASGTAASKSSNSSSTGEEANKDSSGTAEAKYAAKRAKRKRKKAAKRAQKSAAAAATPTPGGAGSEMPADTVAAASTSAALAEQATSDSDAVETSATPSIDAKCESPRSRSRVDDGEAASSSESPQPATLGEALRRTEAELMKIFDDESLLNGNGDEENDEDDDEYDLDPELKAKLDAEVLLSEREREIDRSSTRTHTLIGRCIALARTHTRTGGAIQKAIGTGGCREQRSQGRLAQSTLGWQPRTRSHGRRERERETRTVLCSLTRVVMDEYLYRWIGCLNLRRERANERAIDSRSARQATIDVGRTATDEAAGSCVSCTGRANERERAR